MSYVIRPLNAGVSRVARPLSGVLCLLSALSLAAATSEIGVDLRLDTGAYIVGERVRGVVDIANSSPKKVSFGYSNSKDRFFIEVFRADGMQALTRVSKHPFVAPFVLESGKGQKLEVFLADHYDLSVTSGYLAKPVLVHDGIRYEGALRAFDVVDGIAIASALQMFANRPGLQRNFTLVHWARQHSTHLFLKASDSGSSQRRFETRDLGSFLRLDKPSIGILPKGEVIVLHRLDNDNFVRTEFWSLPNELEFRHREAVLDPDTAGTARVRELYKEGGVKPKTNPWWKIW